MNMIMAAVALRLRVTGSRMAMVEAGPMPGRTPTNLATRNPPPPAGGAPAAPPRTAEDASKRQQHKGQCRQHPHALNQRDGRDRDCSDGDQGQRPRRRERLLFRPPPPRSAAARPAPAARGDRPPPAPHPPAPP